MPVAAAVCGTLAAMAFLGAPLAAAQEPDSTTGTLDPAAVQKWADALFTGFLAETHVPGAVVVVVDHGRTIVLKGYGATTPRGGEAIDPGATLFRIGSITKVLTATIATQMIEEGAIDPASDVNRYLKGVQIPSAYPEPVTIADLLAHEGGFGADLRGVDAPTAAGADIPPHEIQRLLVPRVRPPGHYIAYDNNGWGVLGLALADAAGSSYHDLVAQRIFQPLALPHAVIGLPSTAAQIEEHYVMPNGEAERIDHQFLKPMEQGAGDASASGADMARLMIALLQKGELDGKRILSPEGFRQLTNFDAHRIHPLLPGLGRAIYEDRPGGQHAMRHDGGMRGSAASMELYPEQQVGVFFAINARPYNPFDGETLSGLLTGVRMFLFGPQPKVAMESFLKFHNIHEDFAAHFFPKAAPPEVPAPQGPLMSNPEIASFAGKYLGTPSQFAAFIGQLQVAVLEGVLVAPDGQGGVSIGGKRYRQIAHGLFEEEKSGARTAFQRTAYGDFMGSSALWIQRRAGWYEKPALTVVPLLLVPLLLACGAFYLLGARRPYRSLGGVAALLGVLYLGGLVLEAQYANQVLIQDREWLAVCWRMLLQAVLLGLLLWPAWLARAWMAQPPGRTVGQIAAAAHFFLMALGCWLLVALAGYWKLIGHL
jgi:CubicO group peptidase (beta-lactamase class C family)